MIIEQTIIEYLSKALTVPVYAEVPDSAPASYVLVEKTSSSRQNHINMATLAVQSYADTLFNAAALSKSVCDALYKAVEFNYTDTQSRKYRYQAVLDCVYFD